MGIFTFPLAGGLTAVIYTDALQTVIMVVGALILMFIGEFFGMNEYKNYKVWWNWMSPYGEVGSG